MERSRLGAEARDAMSTLQGVSRMDRKGAKRFIRQFKQPLVITSVEVAKAVRHRENVMGKTSLAQYKMVLDLEMNCRIYE